MPTDNYGQQYEVTSSGTNDQGNHYCSREYEGGSNDNSYHCERLTSSSPDSNTDGSYYYSNSDGSTYYNSGDGYAQYTNSEGNGWSEKK
ncbi:hypothetical protein JCM11491_006634 [Sporobolomyces phaffii]